MDEISLRAQFERAVAARPPTPHLVAHSLRAGRKLRRRHRIETAVASVGAVAIVAILVPLLSGQLGAARHHHGAAQAGLHAQGIAYVWTTIHSVNGTVTPVRLSTGTDLKTLKFYGAVTNLAAAPDGKAVYVISSRRRYSATQINYLTKINPATGRDGTAIRLAGEGQQIQTLYIAPGGRFAYAVENGNPGAPNAVVSINLATGEQRTLLDVQAAMGVAITPDGKTACIVAITRTPGKMSEWIQSVNVATGAKGKRIQLPGRGSLAGGLTLSADGTQAYLSGGRYLIAVNLATGEVSKPIQLWSTLADYFFSVAVAPDGRTAYAAPFLPWIQPVKLSAHTAEYPVFLPSGYRVLTNLQFGSGRDVAYIGATHTRPAVIPAYVIIPFQLSTQRFGNPIRLPGAPQQIVIVP